MANIIIGERQYNIIKRCILEGVEWSRNDDGSVNLSVNSKTTDKSNSGRNSVDTRLFGNKDEILNGDNTANGNSKSLYRNLITKKAAIQLYKNVIEYVKSGRCGELEIPENTDNKTVTIVNKWFNEGKTNNWIIDNATKSILRIIQDVNPYENTVDRINKEENDKVARYKTGIVNGTDVKYIALFTMSDFNFSDAIKHGTVRQGNKLDSVLGTTKDDREKEEFGKAYATIPVTYDNKYQPNIAQNFSLNNVRDGHYKQQFALNGDDGYSSISQFLDKSVNYAAYALRNENFHPDFIIAPPSSSKFNQYYCTNLSNKLGVPYRNDFFKRNLINVKLKGGKTIDDMLNNGFSEKDIMSFENQIKDVAYKEIAYFISEPIRQLIYGNEQLFANISNAHYSREKVSIEAVFDCLMIYVYRTIINAIQSGNDIIENHLVNNFLVKQNKLQKKYDSNHIFKQINTIINLKIGKKVFNTYLVKTLQLVKQYADILKQKGYKLRFSAKRFKVTQLPKQYRPYLENVYIVADDYMNNGKLMNQYKNAKFLIFDEDINSGTTLKLCIDALEEKLPETTQNNIMCLVNGYSASGW